MDNIFTATLDQMQEPDNAPMRVAAVATGGLFGYVVGALRGKLLKRMLFTTFGAGSVAAIVYPEEAKVRTT